MPPSTHAFDIDVPVLPPRAPRRSGILRALGRDWPAGCAAAFLLLLVLATVGGARLTGYAYDHQDLDHTFSGPGAGRWVLGTDQYGRDLLTRILYGGRVSLAVGCAAVAAESVLGVTWGTVAGFYGGRLDAAMMRIVDLLIAFPSLLLAVLVTGIFGPSLVNIVLALTMTAWPGMARTIRSEVVALRERDYIEAARALGAPPARMLVRHLVPNVVHLLAARATLDVSAIVLTEATLSFIGIGVQPPRPSWGLMISESFQSLQSHPYLVVAPAAVLSVTVLSFNLLGEAIAEWADPKLRRRTA
ncbi:MAG TPA: ABC transporter permease [bacterium]|nr:ABC transporter permease [bacterium]